MWHIWETGVVNTEFWLGDLREDLEDLGLDWTILLLLLLLLVMIIIIIIIII
jgi:hypothetical protein